MISVIGLLIILAICIPGAFTLFYITPNVVKEKHHKVMINDLRNLSSLSSDSKDQTLGSLDLELQQKGADIYQSVGLIKNSLDMSQVVTDDLIPKK